MKFVKLGGSLTQRKKFGDVLYTYGVGYKNKSLRVVDLTGDGGNFVIFSQ